MSPDPPAWLPGPMRADPTPRLPRCEPGGVDPIAVALRGVLAGLELGGWDRQVLWWLQRWEPATPATVASLLYRARAAGAAAGAAAEWARLAGLLDVMRTRQAAEWDTSPDPPPDAWQEGYFGALIEAVSVVERGGADGVTVRVDSR